MERMRNYRAGGAPKFSSLFFCSRRFGFSVHDSLRVLDTPPIQLSSMPHHMRSDVVAMLGSELPPIRSAFLRDDCRSFVTGHPSSPIQFFTGEHSTGQPKPTIGHRIAITIVHVQALLTMLEVPGQ